MKGRASISEELKRYVQGEILDDEYSLGIYATDASLYQIFPLCICLPKSKEDIQAVCRIATKYQVPILARGGATSLAGQAVSKAIIIDYSKYLSKILAYNKEEGWISVQPGITRDEINKHVKGDGWHFAPDPATSSQATLGGMIANNSSGTKSIYYGKTSDHLIELEILLPDGTEMNLSSCSAEAYQQKCVQPGREGMIYKKFREIIFQHSEEIAARFPKTMRRVNGYALDAFIDRDTWNLSHLICGSEGTLVLIQEAKIKLCPLPKAKILGVFHFKSRREAVEAVSSIVDFEPAAVEMLDYNVLELSKENAKCRAYHQHCIQGNPQAILITEFYGDSSLEVEQSLGACIESLKKQNKGFDWPIFSTPEAMDKVWKLRKQGLGLIMGNPDAKKPIPFIEDCAIPLPQLANYVERIEKFCASLDTAIVIYAHASVGVLHIRPFLDTRKAEDIDKMKAISAKAFEWVKKYKGSWSGEHGDGMVRSPRLIDFFGETIYASFTEIKNLFDPHHLMNPGKIVEAEPMDQHLRYGSDYRDMPWEAVFHFRKSGSFEVVVHNCSGIGACRKLSGGTMCPSFMATHDEEHSTRGRANTLRLTLSGQLDGQKLPSDRLLQIMDLCISCKACKTECPSNVDMASLKSEVLQKKYDSGRISTREKMIRDSANWSRRYSGKTAPLVNAFQGSRLFRHSFQHLAGLESSRSLPEYAKESLINWYKKRKKQSSGRKVVLFADTYSNCHDVYIGKAAVNLLEDCGYEPLLVDAGCCQRPRISNGFLKLAKKDGARTAQNLADYLNLGLPILMLEPGCASALQLDLPDLIDDESLASQLESGVFLLDEFLYAEMKTDRLKGKFKSKFARLLVHGHCHQKALYGLNAIQNIYAADSDSHVLFPDSGCCGMAGAFGYEKEHYELSRQIGELVLFPAIRQNENAKLVANGFSCRHQIEHFTGRKALHWVETVQFFADNK